MFGAHQEKEKGTQFGHCFMWKCWICCDSARLGPHSYSVTDDPTMWLTSLTGRLSGGWKSGRTPVELSRRWAVWMCGAYRNWSYETRRNCKPFGKLCCYLLEIAVLLRTISNYRIHMPLNTWFKPGVGPPFLGNLASVFQHVPCRPWVIWHASSRCVASKYMELENVKGSPWESCRKPKESKQKLTKC